MRPTHFAEAGWAAIELLAPEDMIVGAVGDFPRLEFSKRDVARAGDALRGDLPWTDEAAQEHAREVYRVANSWRDSHAYPMKQVRFALLGQMQRKRVRGVTAARLKRMTSVRDKLKNHRGDLDQIQDLAGCRAIVASAADVQKVERAIRSEFRHTFYKDYNYILSPKVDGYRSHHIVFAYKATEDDAAYDGRRVEIQLRTRLQHSWATAVEAVGMFRNENFKAGQGDPDWRRLFVLLSAELAQAENSPEGNVPAHNHRVREIRDLDKKLEATALLENINNAVKFTENHQRDTKSKPAYYLISYNNVTKQVSVQTHSAVLSGVKSFDSAEGFGKPSDLNSVLVEADKISNLRVAYPNYFGDVRLFRDNLRRITKGDRAEEYEMAAQEKVKQKKPPYGDLSWVRAYRRWK